MTSLLEDEIALAAQRILSLEDNWDGEGAHPVVHSTWDATVRLLRTFVLAAQLRNIDIPIPDLSACGDGSVDLWWREEAFILLINVRHRAREPDYYFEVKGVKVSSGDWNDAVAIKTVLPRLKTLKEDVK